MRQPSDGRHRAAAHALLLAAAGLVSASVLAARATDRPVAGRSVKLMAAGAKTRLAFASRDPALLFPAIGSGDDPATGTPGGIEIDVFARGAAPASVGAAKGLGTPGWRVVDGKVDTYVYRGRGGPLALALLRRGTLLQVAAADLEMTLAAPLGAVAVRVTTGTLRSCAVFTEGSVRRDRPGLFVARDAAAPQIADCEDHTLLLAIGDPCAQAEFAFCGAPCPAGGICAPADPLSGGRCRCVYPSQPCGDTAPVCGGECPAGEQCWPIDDAIPGTVNACLCAPAGEPPCGASGMTCNGGCPPGLECGLVPGVGMFDDACACVEPDALCGQPGFGDCPHPDFQCILIPGSGHQCLPIVCGGPFPACGGSCTGGRTCVPLDVAGSELCVCATPSLGCDGPACSGLYCPSGDVCTVDVSGGSSTCSCTPREASQCLRATARASSRSDIEERPRIPARCALRPCAGCAGQPPRSDLISESSVSGSTGFVRW
ncbi:MAG: hypothetical protein AB1689_03755 [Thermodesulfobacteriota bacterium]